MVSPLETWQKQIGQAPSSLVKHYNSGWIDQQLKKVDLSWPNFWVNRVRR